MSWLYLTWEFFALSTAFCVFVFCLDDLFIDLIAFVKQLKPKALSDSDIQELHFLPQKKIAIMIANWHEDDIIERMIHGNIGRLDYQNYYFFLGVYPNDLPTVAAVKRLQSHYHNVFMVVNSKNGPTSKGQMLNEIVDFIQATEINLKTAFDIILMQDSEDILHPLSLKLINMEMEKADFLQTPVFSLSCHIKDWTRGTYIDEFAESHTRDLLVRSYLQAGVPSAGVGTAMSRLFVADLLKQQNNQLLKEDTLTEDYYLGITAHRMGYKSHFSCCYIDKKNSSDYIATREYFPASIHNSIRQKTRWTLGISIQGYQNLKWSSKSLVENYFLWRDRRGLLNAPILIFSYLMTLSFLGYYAFLNRWPQFFENKTLKFLLSCTFIFMLNKVFQRARLVYNLYSLNQALTVPVRWFIANYINTLASLKAVKQQFVSVKTGQKPAWVKTTHELPIEFGHESILRSDDYDLQVSKNNLNDTNSEKVIN